MDGEPRVTEADREAACKLLGYKDWGDATDYRNSGRSLDAVGRAAQAFAKHRQAALIEGARVGLEHAKGICADYVTFCGAQPLWPDEPGTSIGCADPATIIAQYLEEQG